MNTVIDILFPAIDFFDADGKGLVKWSHPPPPSTHLSNPATSAARWRPTAACFAFGRADDFLNMPPPDGAGISFGIGFLQGCRADGAGLGSRGLD